MSGQRLLLHAARTKFAKEKAFVRQRIHDKYNKRIQRLQAELDSYTRLLTVRSGNQTVKLVGTEAKLLAASKRTLLNTTQKEKHGRKKNSQ